MWQSKHTNIYIYIFLLQISQSNKPDGKRICFDIRTSEHSCRTTFVFWEILQNGQAYLWFADVKKYELDSFFPGTVLFCHILAVCCKTKMWLAWATGDHMSLIPWARVHGWLVSLVPAYIELWSGLRHAFGNMKGVPRTSSPAVKC